MWCQPSKSGLRDATPRHRTTAGAYYSEGNAKIQSHLKDYLEKKLSKMLTEKLIMQHIVGGTPLLDIKPYVPEFDIREAEKKDGLRKMCINFRPQKIMEDS